MGELFSETKRNLLAKTFMDVFKYTAVAAMPTEFFAQLPIAARILIATLIAALFFGAWFICPDKAEKE